MSKKGDTKQVQKGRVVKQSCRLGSRNLDSEQGYSDSAIGDTGRNRDKWPEEAVYNEPLVNKKLLK